MHESAVERSPSLAALGYGSSRLRHLRKSTADILRPRAAIKRLSPGASCGHLTVGYTAASSRSSQDEGGFRDSILAPLMYVSARLHRRDDPRKADRYTQSMQAWYLRPAIVRAAPLSRQRGPGPMNCPIRCHISTGFEYIGKCPL